MGDAAAAAAASRGLDPAFFRGTPLLLPDSAGSSSSISQSRSVPVGVAMDGLTAGLLGIDFLPFSLLPAGGGGAAGDGAGTGGGGDHDDDDDDHDDGASTLDGSASTAGGGGSGVGVGVASSARKGGGRGRRKGKGAAAATAATTKKKKKRRGGRARRAYRSLRRSLAGTTSRSGSAASSSSSSSSSAAALVVFSAEHEHINLGACRPRRRESLRVLARVLEVGEEGLDKGVEYNVRSLRPREHGEAKLRQLEGMDIGTSGPDA